MKSRQPSLKRRLILQPLLVNALIILLAFFILITYRIRADTGGTYTDELITRVAAQAVQRAADGSLQVTQTPELRELKTTSPNLWFIAKDEDGKTVSYGNVPAEYSTIVPVLGDISYAVLRDRTPPYRLAAVVNREGSPAGTLTVMGQGQLTSVALVVLVASNLVVLPIIAFIGLGSMILTPWIVRRTLRGVSQIASEAERINVDERGLRLSESEVPQEIAPLVRAVNDALARLDEGYERQQRFIGSAAHELRTPIAILRTKIDAMPERPAEQLSGEVARLATLAEQLLDLQRLDQQKPMQRTELAALLRRVAAELAPLLIANGQSIEVDADDATVVLCDAGALERVVANLVQNAVEHGGQNVTLRASGSSFEVQDDGPGIPLAERERVFEAFHRLRPRSTGTGLGLSLVRQVVERHHGSVSIHDAPGGGTVMRVSLPPA